MSIATRNGNGATEIIPAAPYGEDGGEVQVYRDGPSALESMARAEVDLQIATAQRYPRSITKFVSRCKSEIELDQESAEECTYTLPRFKTVKTVDEKGRNVEKKVPITGPSIRLAEILAPNWKNLRVATRIIREDHRSIVVQGNCLDLEANVGYSIEVPRGITYNNGNRYNNDMIVMTSLGASSIARRNVIFMAIPGVYVKLLHNHARTVAKGELSTLPERRAAAVKYFTDKGVQPLRIFESLGCRGIEDMDLDDLVNLKGFATSLKDGMSLDDLFPDPSKSTTVVGPGESKAAALGAALRSRPNAQQAAPRTPPPPVAGSSPPWEGTPASTAVVESRPAEQPKTAPETPRQQAPSGQPEAWETWSQQVVKEANDAWKQELIAESIDDIKPLINSYELVNLVTRAAIEAASDPESRDKIKADVSKDGKPGTRDQPKATRFVAGYFRDFPAWVKETVTARLEAKRNELRASLKMFDPTEDDGVASGDGE